MIAAECARLSSLGHVIEVTPAAVEFLVRVGYHRILGARPMRATVERYLQEAVATDILTGGSGCGRIEVNGNTESVTVVDTARVVSTMRR
ncbi:MAG: hypothetical protein Q7S40_33970 [Opitutaceae bacterium]|nr:hypothetical protein [Opitutaceae bacterium]